MNPYKTAILLVQELLTENYMPVENDRREKAIREVVKSELDNTFDWICAEENGLTKDHITNAHQFGFNDRRRTCDACSQIADVHMLATRGDTGETKEVYACKAHMLDPGPLLDY